MAKKLTMKGLLSKKRKARTPPALVKHIRDLLIFVNGNTDVLEQKRKDKKMADLAKSMLEMRTLLYGDGESEPNKEACAHLTQEFFKDDTFRLLIVCLSKLSLETRRNATHVVANLQRQQVQSRLVSSDYMEKNMNLMDILIPGYEDYEIALSYGAISRECIRHQTVARYVLESDHMKKFFYYIQIPNFEIASDASATFKELMTRHKSTVAQFLSSNYDWFFQEYNSQLLQSQNYITKRQALKLLRDILLDRANCDITVRYVCSLDNMRILMNLLRDPNKTIQLETFHVFKLFVANQNKPPEIVNVLVTNRSKLLRFLGDFKTEKENEQFEEDKAAIIKEISLLEGIVIKEFSSILSFRQNCEIPC